MARSDRSTVSEHGLVIHSSCSQSICAALVGMTLKRTLNISDVEAAGFCRDVGEDSRMLSGCIFMHIKPSSYSARYKNEPSI